MSDESLKENDRVKRVGRPGCYGTVLEIREEVTGTAGEATDKALLVKVKWDNGTTSMFAPEGLENVNG